MATVATAIVLVLIPADCLGLWLCARRVARATATAEDYGPGGERRVEFERRVWIVGALALVVVLGLFLSGLAFVGHVP